MAGSQQDEFGPQADRVETLSLAICSMFDHRDTLIATFDDGLAMLSIRQDLARIEGLARDLDTCDRQLAMLVGEMATMLTSPILQAFLAKP